MLSYVIHFIWWLHYCWFYEGKFDNEKKNFSSRLNVVLELIAHWVVTTWIENILGEPKFLQYFRAFPSAENYCGPGKHAYAILGFGWIPQ